MGAGVLGIGVGKSKGLFFAPQIFWVKFFFCASFKTPNPGPKSFFFAFYGGDWGGGWFWPKGGQVKKKNLTVYTPHFWGLNKNFFTNFIGKLIIFFQKGYFYFAISGANLKKKKKEPIFFPALKK